MPKETELKYVLSSRAWEALLVADGIAGYHLDAAETSEIHDVYADTPDRVINAHGFAFRIRSDGSERRIACLKSLAKGDGLAHRRDEFECSIDPSHAPEEWPDGETRNRFLAMTGGRKVRTEVEIFQTRIRRMLRSQDAAIAEVSLDQVRLKTPAGEHVFFELEVEAMSDSWLGHLKEVDKELTAQFDLMPLNTSKFERAMALRNGDPVPDN